MSSKDVESWYAGAPEAVRPLLGALRQLVRSTAPDAAEQLKWARPCYSNERGLFCYLHHGKGYATLGFQKGASLADPENLLEGSGKAMRHVKVRSIEALDERALGDLIREAERA